MRCASTFAALFSRQARKHSPLEVHSSCNNCPRAVISKTGRSNDALSYLLLFFRLINRKQIPKLFRFSIYLVSCHHHHYWLVVLTVGNFNQLWKYFLTFFPIMSQSSHVNCGEQRDPWGFNSLYACTYGYTYSKWSDGTTWSKILCTFPMGALRKHRLVSIRRRYKERLCDGNMMPSFVAVSGICVFRRES